MITVSNDLIMSGNFQKSMANMAMQKLPPKTAFDLKVMMNRLDTSIKAANEVKMSIFKEYCQVDDKGELVRAMQTVESKDGQKIEAPIPNSVVPIEETKEEFEKAFSEWKEITHEIKGSKLTVEALGKSEISAYDLTILEPLMDFNEKPDLAIV